MKYRMIILLFSIIPAMNAFPAGEESLMFGPFGKVIVYRSTPDPGAIVLFVSGDGGWNQGVVDMAKLFSDMNAMVVGIDIVTYFKNLRKSAVKCYYPASDFENLSIFIQKKLAVKQYKKPVLAGYSSGATLVYALLAQAPANTYKGAIALGFCPDIEIDRPLCEGSGLKSKVLKPGRSFDLEPCERLSAPLIVLNGTNDAICDHSSTSDFIKRTGNAGIVSLPKVGHGFSVWKNWVPQLKESFRKILDSPELFSGSRPSQAEEPGDKAEYALIRDLPVIADPAEKTDTMPMVLMISGDGGWTGWDQSLAHEFNRKGYAVAGLDSQRYFWEEKDPETVTCDLANVLKYYAARWNKNSFILAGYSFGANVVPFIATRLKPPLREGLHKVVLMSPDASADFEIHIADMLDIGSDDGRYNVITEVRSLSQTPVLCIFGDSEDEPGKQLFRLPHVRVVDIPGSHHYRDNFPLIVETILNSH